MSGSDETGSAYRDRRTRLALFGVLTILLGVGCGLFGLAYLLLPLFGSPSVGGGALAIEPRAALVGALTYVLLGGVLVWAGAGSLRGRRWTRPVMLTLAWAWLLTGLLFLGLLLLVADDLVGVATTDLQPLPAEVRLVVKLFLFGVTTLFGVLLPLLYVWAYTDRDLQKTCDALDPSPGWADRGPATVHGLGLGLGAAALFALPLAIQPAVPLFGWVVTGWPGALLTLAGVAACGWLARATLRLQMTGWWGTLILMVLLGISTMLTVTRGGLAEMLGGLGYAEEQAIMLGDSMGPAAVWASAAVTVATVVYMLAIRRHFRGSDA